MLKVAFVVCLLPWWLPAEPDQPQPIAADVIPKLIGQWVGQGQLFGRPAEFAMRWEWELDRRFVRLTFENRLVEDGGARTVLRATAHYRVGAADGIDGAWFDTRGKILKLAAHVDGSTLITQWYGDAEQGRTSYRVTAEDTVEVEDEVLGEEGWRVFGRASYRRAAAAEPPLE